MNQIGREPEGRTVTAILGPTNTGKTHYAIERMLGRTDGVIGLPLRLLAREVYDRIVALRGPGAVALLTGEEKIVPPNARYHVCTVEAMPLDLGTDFVAVDEIQLCADPDRGHVFTDRLMRARGRYETLFLGSETMRARIAGLVPGVRFMGRERFSTLSYAGPRKISRLRPRTAVVAFSADQVYAIAELIRRQRGGAAVVLGALSPRTRNAQVALYQNGDVDYLVATDAIGMGLNMDVDHVAFAGLAKFDGHRHRSLAPDELAQIAGRAGRHMADGTFGVTGEAHGLDAETVEAIENHAFRPVTRLMWRNHAPDFGSVARLIASLEANPGRPDLMRAREADDLAALKAIDTDPELARLADRPDRVRLLWDACQIPDFRKTGAGDHAGLIGRIYRFLLSERGVIPSDWISGQVRRIDRVDGDIDALSKRLAFIRTWTYVANRGRWLDDPAEWREATREVEDRLSDALHQRLTQRFVDRRTSVLMRRLKQKERLVAEVNDKGEVTVEGEFIGRLDGFRFTVDQTATGDELKTLQSTSVAALQSEFARRADKLYLSPDTEIDVTEQGGLMWGDQAIGRVEKGDTILAPRVRVFIDDIVEPTVAEKIERRLTHWLARRIAALFEPLVAMQADEAVTGLARGVAFRLGEGLGIQPRRAMADDIRALGQEERASLRKHGVRFGQHNVFMPALLKPAPTRMRLILWSLWEGLEDFPSAPPAGHVTVPVAPGMPQGYYEKAGYRVCGPRAVRIDMLERLADMIRPLDVRGGFEATADMLSITGCTLDQFAEIMKGLGFMAERGERPKAARPAAEPAAPARSAPDEVDGAGAVAEAAAAPEAAGQAEALVAEAAVAPEETAGGTADAEAATALAAEPAPETEAKPAPVAEPAPAAEAEPVAEAKPVAEPAQMAEAAPAAEVQPEAPGEAPLPVEGAAPAEPPAGSESAVEIEAFFTFTLRPRPRPGRGQAREQERSGQERAGHGHRERRGGAKKDADGAGGGDGERPGKPRGTGPGKGRKGKPGFEHGGKRPPRGDEVRASAAPPRPRREDKPVDPDSPFAILQQLKKP
ncbi:disulfide oxidoreductase [Limibaculum sp. FT325]|uniref:helicase-related protein n=1 Tax=Thermohalobaculum sediminis TaxID=2939436 RepID=UPI0020C06A0B|nr:helicase-related protein [Limibaculum sediminis]MCL5775790.1 disulfide oxidoreductase [Limibaculum sediminis]